MKSYVKNVREKLLERILGNYKLYILILILIMLLLYTYLFLDYSLCLRKGGFDTYSHIGIIKAIQIEFFSGTILPDTFPYLYVTDPHIGINFISMSFISEILDSQIYVLLIAGLFNIGFFIISMYYFSLTYLNSEKKAILATIFALTLVSTNSWVGTSLFSLPDLLVIGHYPAILGLSILLLLLTMNLKYFKTQNTKLLFPIFVLFLILLLSHLVSVFIYLVILFILLISNLWEERKLNTHSFLILIPIISGLILSLLWPFYNWLDVFISSNPIQTGPAPIDTYSLQFLVESLGMNSLGIIFFVIGLIGLIHSKDKFLLLWLLIFVLISLAFLFPFRIPMYWRFVPFIKIPIILGLVYFIFSYRDILPRFKSESFRKTCVYGFVLLISVSFLAIGLANSVIPLIKDESVVDQYSFLNDYDQESLVILTYDSWESYPIQGLTEFSVIMVPVSHIGDVSLWDQIVERENRTILAYEHSDEEILTEIILEFEVSYAIVPKTNKNVNSTALISTFEDIGWIPVFENSSYILVMNNNHS